MYVQLGDQVKQGQLIAQIDSIRQGNELKTAKANIQNQQAQLAVQQANLAKVEAGRNASRQCLAKMQLHVQNLETALANFKQHKLKLQQSMRKLNNLV